MRICLSMIVRDEAHVIERCLASVRPHIAAWVVCDTGSTDATPDLVSQALAGIPGQLYHDEWRDFGHNRTLAVQRALAMGCDYVLTIDADELLVLAETGALDALAEPAYVLRCIGSGVTFLSLRLARADLPWRWEAPIHEYLECDQPVDPALLEGVYLTTPQDGARSRDPQSKERDLAMLEAAVVAEPDNTRQQFYLAGSYQITGRLDQALTAYRRRAEMTGGNSDEVWYSRYQIAVTLLRMEDWHGFIRASYEAYAADPRRAEPLYWLARNYMARGLLYVALPLLELAARKDAPPGAFMLEAPIYDYQAWLFTALCCKELGRQGDAREIVAMLLDCEAIPAADLHLVEGLRPAPAAMGVG